MSKSGGSVGGATRRRGGAGDDLSGLSLNSRGNGSNYRFLGLPMGERVKLIATAALLLFFIGAVFHSSSGPEFVRSNLRSNEKIVKSEIKVASWNMAAINNNPFEYWLTLDNPAYDHVMNQVQSMITTPGPYDVKVKEVFTQDMFDQLVLKMKEQDNFDNSAIQKVVKLWKSDFSNRKIISEFLKDGSLGKKRLTSMPDRITNTIALRDGFAYRPTVINCYQEHISSVEDWWSQWRTFMFVTQIDTVKSGKLVPAKMLGKIPRAKYPLLTEEEEEISVPLQTLCQALFDGILVHLMSVVDTKLDNEGLNESWQGLRLQICESLNLKKNTRILEILGSEYLDRDVVFLQEVASSFIDLAKRHEKIAQGFHIIAPKTKSKSDQNSVILLSKERFPNSITDDITNRLKFEDPKMVASGDIILVHATDVFHTNFVLASFHGDTNGLATIPVVQAVQKAVHSTELLLFGLDANTYSHGIPGQKQDVIEFAKAYTKLNLNSCWGPEPDRENFTTYNARTFLQAQLNKAARKNEIKVKGDVNPKDFILFRKGTMSVLEVQKDNTGSKRYEEEMVFPTLEFPSDHGILSAGFKIN